MSWSDKYIGLPEAGCHCWGLAVRVYAGELGIVLPTYEGAVTSPQERTEIAAMIQGEAQSGPWFELWRASKPEPFDILVFRRGKHRSHIGIALNRDLMLHMQGWARVERCTGPIWKPRLTGIYRHIQSPSARPS